MDLGRFDTFTRNLTIDPNRRVVLRLLAGAALGGPSAIAVLARLGFVPELAAGGNRKKRRQRNRKCKSNQVKCGRHCLPKDADICCVAGEPWVAQGQCGSCRQGQMVPEQIWCKGRDPHGCTVCNPQTFNCEPGNEDQPCGPAGWRCRGGLCQEVCGDVFCPAGQECCLDPNQNTVSCRPIDPKCGACKQSCGSQCCKLFETCSNGKCCPPGWFGCQGNAPACCPHGTKCCPGLNYCCDRAKGCHCPDDDNVCEEQLCP